MAAFTASLSRLVIAVLLAAASITLPRAHGQAVDLFSPQSQQLRATIAANVSTGLSPQLAAALVQVAKASEVNDQDAQTAITTLQQALLPWQNNSAILLPQTPGAAVPVWTATIAAPAGDPASSQPVPLATSQPACCAQLRALGFRSNLPVVVADAGGKVVPIRESVPVKICVCGAQPDQDYEGVATLQVRGSSSAVQEIKKSFGLTFRKANATAKKGSTAQPPASGPTLGGKEDVPFLGMRKADSWVLYGDNTDQTIGMRNALAYHTARAMGRWAPHAAYAELFLVQDGAPLGPQHYWGAYLALEKIEIHPSRVNITAAGSKKAKDLTGGYLLGYERSLWPSDIRVQPSQWSGAPLTTCPTGDGRNLTYVLQDPTPNDIAKSQQGLGPVTNDTKLVAWAASYLGSVEAALVRAAVPNVTGYLESTSGGGWRALVDQGAFIDYLFAQEIPKNPDANRGSVYFYKPPGQPLVLGPPWDYNEAFGACCGYPIEGYQNQGISNGTSGGSAISSEGWRFTICDEPNRCVVDPVDGISLWYRAVWRREPAFRAAVAARWQELRRGPLSDAFFTDRFNFYQTQLRYAAPRNYLRWDAFVRTPSQVPQDVYTQAVPQLQTWTLARVRWIDQALAQVTASDGAQAPAGAGLDAGASAAVMAAVVACADQAAASVRV